MVYDTELWPSNSLVSESVRQPVKGELILFASEGNNREVE